jgi:hypothetical protein
MGIYFIRFPDVQVKSNPAMGLLIFCNEENTFRRWPGKLSTEIGRAARNIA